MAPFSKFVSSALLASRASDLPAVPSGGIRVLLQNDLSKSLGSTALLLYDVAADKASSACQAYGESLLAYVDSDIRDQLNYLKYIKEIDDQTKLTVAGEDHQCREYLVGKEDYAVYDCEERSSPKHILCTNSAPAYKWDGAFVNKTFPANSYPVTVKSKSGKDSFVGHRDARSFRFVGVPFAEPPLGDLRFELAQRYSAGYDMFNANTFGPGCIQALTGPRSVGTGDADDISEDCLTLNIYTPALPAHNGRKKHLKPVAYWIYGGGLIGGSGQSSIYDGGNFASREDVVLVTVNYRLGPLGFLGSDDLPGSQGISDTIQGLKWIQEHIETFGGDKDRVTVYGESAGAQATLALISSTPAKGLFQRAIVQSGAPGAIRPDYGRELSQQRVYQPILNRTGCLGEADGTACLRRLNASVVFEAGVDLTTIVTGNGVVDNAISALVDRDQVPNTDIDLMYGNNRHERNTYWPLYEATFAPIFASLDVATVTLADIAAAIRAVAPNQVETILANADLFPINRSDPNALQNIMLDLGTLNDYQCPMNDILTKMGQKNIFRSLRPFIFDEGLSAPSLPGSIECRENTRVCHGGEIIPAFGTANVVDYPNLREAQIQFMQYITDNWGAFMRTGNPQPDPEWLKARGRSYEVAYEYKQSAPFTEWPNVQIFDNPPANGALPNITQCAVFRY